eukprot:2331485-Lingulodinium_polyedra.AAC.1
MAQVARSVTRAARSMAPVARYVARAMDLAAGGHGYCSWDGAMDLAAQAISRPLPWILLREATDLAAQA